MSKYIIGSGWWCSGDGEKRKTMGDDSIRTADFHSQWYESIETFTSPEKIIIVDSNSPIKPAVDKSDARIEFISLNKNSGHSSQLNHGSKYCGWTSSVLLSLDYALHCECDYYVYVEQDVLLYGDNILSDIISNMKSNNNNYAFGHPGNTPQPLQQSLFVIKKSFIEDFSSRYKSVKSSDLEISPEIKFYMAVSFWVRIIPEYFLKKRFVQFLLRKVANINFFEIGYGRIKPVDFRDNQFYFQHGVDKELNDYYDKIERYKSKS